MNIFNRPPKKIRNFRLSDDTMIQLDKLVIAANLDDERYALYPDCYSSITRTDVLRRLIRNAAADLTKANEKPIEENGKATKKPAPKKGKVRK